LIPVPQDDDVMICEKRRRFVAQSQPFSIYGLAVRASQIFAADARQDHCHVTAEVVDEVETLVVAIVTLAMLALLDTI
jgi:hypothetical protein